MTYGIPLEIPVKNDMLEFSFSGSGGVRGKVKVAI